MRLMQGLSVALALISLGCSPSGAEHLYPNSAEFVAYDCMANQRFDIALLPDQQAVILRFADQRLRLTQVPSGSGVKYVRYDHESLHHPAVILHTKGDQALLEIDDLVYKNCKTH
ncbi:MliC family protein [Vibrio ostreicida]|uniref:MliC family protein n=1 Tax=Vibrio ostreicida TaxID=526588 RepID=A0ABT8BQ97_9VIBR|nr:MliC family protein [Vibrio ostreicida]MDN3609285.1 MliC family protein [Vibrio ostreicida]NPD08176.1 MliC family protein [Vibrio ostreicida]